MEETKINQGYSQNDEIELSEIIAVLWKWKVLIIVLPLVAAIIAFTASQFMTPTYKSSTKLYLGNFGNEMYTNSDGAEQVIMSRDLLTPVMEELELEYERVRNFRNIISVNSLPSSMIEIVVSYHEPEKAQEIANAIIDAFITKADPSYQEKLALVEQLYDSTLAHYERTSESLDRNKQALTDVEQNQELSNAEKDLTRARLIDYITADENKIVSIESQLQSQQLQLLDIEKAEVFETASLPHSPSSPNKMLNTAIAIVVGGMLAVGIAFLMEYFKNNPIRRENQ
ncbi:YveK family protein [Bacillus sp. FJAT-45350]|uniref:YveK family protein n=1 Tax=Bacillus sp. FJAT-45350 TaxID=2011014 RepID=UPI000BB91AA7|nr:Wzz/FepE/Etk N-terminal domain-containing protein [Bacillus sp. FJAT-45350]